MYHNLLPYFVCREFAWLRMVELLMFNSPYLKPLHPQQQKKNCSISSQIGVFQIHIVKKKKKSGTHFLVFYGDAFGVSARQIMLFFFFFWISLPVHTGKIKDKWFSSKEEQPPRQRRGDCYDMQHFLQYPTGCSSHFHRLLCWNLTFPKGH